MDKQYNELLKYRKPRSKKIIEELKKKIYDYFKNVTNAYNLEENMDTSIEIYDAPVRNIRGCNLVCYATEKGSEIYVDESYKDNKLLYTQIAHEEIHALINYRKTGKYFFGHKHNIIKETSYIGINEATSQMYGEEVTGTRLDKDGDYLYILKNIMRVMKVLFTPKVLADQYLSNNMVFEKQFNRATKYKFDEFNDLMNGYYKLSKKNFYDSLTENEAEDLELKENALMKITAEAIGYFMTSNPYIINDVFNELKDEEFEAKLNIIPISNRRV